MCLIHLSFSFCVIQSHHQSCYFVSASPLSPVQNFIKLCRYVGVQILTQLFLELTGFIFLLQSGPKFPSPGNLPSLRLSSPGQIRGFSTQENRYPQALLFELVCLCFLCILLCPSIWCFLAKVGGWVVNLLTDVFGGWWG